MPVSTKYFNRIIEVALDDERNAALRDPDVLLQYLDAAVSDASAQYYVLLDEVQFAISDEEFRSKRPPKIYGVLNGLLRKKNVDVGVVEVRRDSGKDGNRVQLEADFVASLGSERYYIQSAYALPTEEKEKQEKASLRNINDSFKKIVVVHDVVRPSRDESGIVTLSIYDFLTNPNALLL